MTFISQFEQARTRLAKLIIGKEEQINLAITCLLANGHLLIEDLPGMGKTTLSHGLANVFGLDFNRVQFTSDMLPADLLGVNVFNTEKREFEFHHGPVFSQVLLADEINRASPKTQSALLEAMEEHQVSIDGVSHPLPEPFVVIATQNPLHQSGTYPLPESQLDRFLMCIGLGYPDLDSERAMLMAEQQQRVELSPVMDASTLQHAQSQVDSIYAAPALIEYILKLVNLSRQQRDIENPLSPRASKAILKAARAHALLHGRDHATPDDVKRVFAATCEHRLRGQHHEANTSISSELLNQVDPIKL